MCFENLNNLLIEATEKSIEMDYPKSEKLLEKAITLFPENYLPYYNLGVLYIEWDKPDKAYELLSKAMTLNPEDPDIMIEAALAMQLSGDPDRAVELYKKAIEIAEEGMQKAIIYNNIGAIYFDKNNFSLAKEYFLNALSEEEYDKARENLILSNIYLNVIS